MDKQEAIVIGGGIGGLTVAGLLAARGMRVLLLEKEAKAGGYVTGFWRDDFYFDATGAFVASCKPGGEFYRILEELNVLQELSFSPIGTIWNIYPDFKLQTDYSDPDAYLEAVKEEFPEYANPIERYGRLTRALGREFQDFEKAALWKKLLLPVFFPILFKNARKSHAHILKKFFNNDLRLYLALSALPTTLPPSRLSYAFVAVLWAKVLGYGVFYPRGGMLNMIDRMTAAFEKNGGRIENNQTVSGILTHRSKAVGVRLANGTQIYAPWIIGSINLFQGEKLLPRGQRLYGRMHRLDRYRTSLSAVIFYVALPPHSLPENWPYFISIHTDMDQEKMYRALAGGSFNGGHHLVITTPTVLDPSLAPPGHHSLKILVHAPPAGVFAEYQGYRGGINDLRKRVFGIVKQRTGLDIEKKAVFVEAATPQTLMNKTGNQDGTMYGLDAACGQVGPQRPPNRTALDNLLWVGHYTRPSHGIVGSAMAGRFAAEIVLASQRS